MEKEKKKKKMMLLVCGCFELQPNVCVRFLSFFLVFLFLFCCCLFFVSFWLLLLCFVITFVWVFSLTLWAYAEISFEM